MKKIFYQVIYYPPVNWIIRSIGKILGPILPKSLRISPSGVIRLRVANERINIATNQTSYLTHLLFWKGPLNFEYTPIFIELLAVVDCFVDIGTNIGYYSILASKFKPDAKIISFEPASGPLHYLEKNVQINNCKNIAIFPIALSDNIGTIKFFEARSEKYEFLEHNLAGDGNTDYLSPQRHFEVVKVQTTTFDHFLETHNIDRKIDLVKIDTEGTEHLILKHSEKILTIDRPIIICETLYGAIEAELQDIFSRHDYLFFNHTGKNLTQVEKITRSFDNGITNCFFVPKEKLSTIEKFL